MAVVADPLWINASAGAPAYSANELRQAMALALQYNGRTLGARAGVRPGGNSLQTSIAGSTITVRAGVACVDPGLTTAQGPYWVCLPSDDTFTLTAAHATLPRKDITILRVYDHDEDSSGLRKAQAEYLVGTAAGSPSEPAVPAGSFKLATIDVPSVASGNPPVVTINYPFTVAAGGVLPVRNTTERGLITPYDGMGIWRQDIDRVEFHDGTNWLTQGLFICTAATRPAAPYQGQEIYETDTRLRRFWNGTAWACAVPQEFHARASSDLTITTSEADVPGATVTFTTLVAGATATILAIYEYREITTVTGYVRARYQVDGATQAPETLTATGAAAENRQPLVIQDKVTLASAGSHTIKLRGIRDDSTGSCIYVGGTPSGTSIRVTVSDW